MRMIHPIEGQGRTIHDMRDFFARSSLILLATRRMRIAPCRRAAGMMLVRLDEVTS